MRPELVCTVKYISGHQDGRLRAPVFVGLRPDVEPKERSAIRSPSAERSAPAEARCCGQIRPRPNLTSTAQLKFTNLNKVFYPKEGYTKRDLLNYYDAVADLIVPHLKGRPLSLKRYPNGIADEFFFQKRSAKSFPDWMQTESIYSEHNKATIGLRVCNDRALRCCI